MKGEIKYNTDSQQRKVANEGKACSKVKQKKTRVCSHTCDNILKEKKRKRKYSL